MLIIGAGALGSPVAEQLAKSGVGKLTLVDDDTLSSANIGRHTLGANSIGSSKVDRLAKSISVRWASCNALGFSMSIQKWLKNNTLIDVDIVLDLTGEPDVRLRIDQERKKNNIDLVIAWMEPYVASAHACLLPAGDFWVTNDADRLKSLNAIDWPDEVILNEPACSSSFQSYTSAAATHAVALTTEATLDLIDKKVESPIVRHWIRGQKYLDKCHTGLQFKEWAKKASDFDGLIIEDNL
ncbi:HesA/MoeB/ThiF family protein [Microbulbifer taiwanensis]|uniref:HesA/MoeB/ThiF family protein n=1 Tax=Microbulbifer taiwanensis TaxID=986746 RepID=UPI00360BB69C